MNVGVHRILGEAETYQGEVVPVYSASKELTTRKIRQVYNAICLYCLGLPVKIRCPKRFGAKKAFRNSRRHIARSTLR
jgi:hypothetical protein